MKLGNRASSLLKYTKAKSKLNEFNVSHDDQSWKTLDKYAINDMFYSTVRILTDFSKKYYYGVKDIDDLKKDLSKVAAFYEYYIGAANQQKDNFLYLTGACANFLSDNFGNAKALCEKIDFLNTGEEDVSKLLFYIFKLVFSRGRVNDHTNYFTNRNYYEIWFSFKKTLESTEETTFLENKLNDLIDDMLFHGTPEDSFFSIILRAIFKKTKESSATRIVPELSNSTYSLWKPYFDQSASIKVLWQSQRMVVDNGVLQGKDATIQLPTGVGKTKSAELIIASAMLIRKIKIAIVVSPLKALCNEIKNELKISLKGIAEINEVTDVIQDDFADSSFLENWGNAFSVDTVKNQVFILTPEKLYFLIRHTNQLVENCGLIIFDEAHQFDNSNRGATYELLVTKIKDLMPQDAQKVYMSAILSNASQLNEWLTKEGVLLSDKNIKKTDKSIGFYTNSSHRIDFFESGDLLGKYASEVFIPNPVTQIYPISFYSKKTTVKKGTTDEKQFNVGDIKKAFPDATNAISMALYFALNVCVKGGVALYVSKPFGNSPSISALNDLATTIMGKVFSEAEMIERSNTNVSEKQKISHLIEEHYGNGAFTGLISFCVFPHYGNLENGIRLSIEYAMREQLISMVACTSTLAEGVNLPFKYLILTSFNDYNGEIMSVRKFQNLFGRTARSGKHTEGSLLCVDSHTYDNRKNTHLITYFNWEKITKLFNPENNEVCGSALLMLCDTLSIYYDGNGFSGTSVLKALIKVYENNGDIFAIKEDIKSAIRKKEKRASQILPERTLEHNIDSRLQHFADITKALESFFLYEIDGLADEDKQKMDIDKFALEIFKKTLANHLADEDSEDTMKELFISVGQKVSLVGENKRLYYKTSLLGLKELQQVDMYIFENKENLLTAPLRIEAWKDALVFLTNELFKNDSELTKNIFTMWLNGFSLIQMFNTFPDNLRSQPDILFDLEKFCHNFIGFKVSLMLNAMEELSNQYETPFSFSTEIKQFQKRLKYGLPNAASVASYESGFSDRIVAQKVGQMLIEKAGNDGTIVYFQSILETCKEKIFPIIDEYPAYFKNIAQKV